MIVELFNPDEVEPSRCLVRAMPLHDGIKLAVVDAEGKALAGGNLLFVNPHGVKLYKDIKIDFGLPLDDLGRLQLVGYR